jgi:8-hydroxy-5-deazaflavin:NADPH oxidoreductase
LRGAFRRRGDPTRSVLAIAADDPSAKTAVTEFLDTIGYDAYDAGALADSWRFEPGAPAYGALYTSVGAGWPPPPGSGRQVTADQMRAALAEASR